MIVLTLLLLASSAASQPVRPVPSHAPAAALHQRGAAATVNGVPITLVRLAVAVDALLPGAAFHGNVREATRREITDRALQGLITEELWVQEARRRGLVVSAAEIDAGLARARRRYRGRGSFDDARRRSGARVADVREAISRALIVEKAYTRWVTSACVVSPAEAAEYFKANPERFVTPPRRRVSIITVGVDPSAPANVRQAARARIEEIDRQVRAGIPFEELARKHSTDPSRAAGGDLGLMHRGQLLEDFEKVLDGMRLGATSGVVQTIYGYHVLRLVSNEPPVRKSFEEVRDSLVASLTKSRCEELRERKTSSLRRAARVEIDAAALRDASARK